MITIFIEKEEYYPVYCRAASIAGIDGNIQMTQAELDEWKKAEVEWNKWQRIVEERFKSCL